MGRYSTTGEGGRQTDFCRTCPRKRGFNEEFVRRFHESALTVRTGVFGEMMEVALVNDGPVTVLLDSRAD